MVFADIGLINRIMNPEYNALNQVTQLMLTQLITAGQLFKFQVEPGVIRYKSRKEFLEMKLLKDDKNASLHNEYGNIDNNNVIYYIKQLILGLII